MDDTGIEPGTSHMLSECDNQLHQTPLIYFCKSSAWSLTSEAVRKRVKEYKEDIMRTSWDDVKSTSYRKIANDTV